MAVSRPPVGHWQISHCHTQWLTVTQESIPIRQSTLVDTIILKSILEKNIYEAELTNLKIYTTTMSYLCCQSKSYGSQLVNETVTEKYAKMDWKLSGY